MVLAFDQSGVVTSTVTRVIISNMDPEIFLNKETFLETKNIGLGTLNIFSCTVKSFEHSKQLKGTKYNTVNTYCRRTHYIIRT